MHTTALSQAALRGASKKGLDPDRFIAAVTGRGRLSRADAISALELLAEHRADPERPFAKVGPKSEVGILVDCVTFRSRSGARMGTGDNKPVRFGQGHY